MASNKHRYILNCGGSRVFNIYMGIELVANVRLIEQLRTATASAKLTWGNGGMFRREMDGGLEDDEIKDLVASANQFDLRPTSTGLSLLP